MNEHKFCFIICTNNDTYLEECIHYLNHLIIPEGYEIDLITIKDAPCITQGYNEGMLASDAKYKIYMHQDVFILNKNLLGDLLSIFEADKQIGMIGLVGYEKVSPTGVMWYEPRTGGIYTTKYQYPPLEKYQYSILLDYFTPVAIIDGLFMATSYDLPWNTEDLDGWDYYDAFQSMNFLENGYKIAVPTQKHPWCLHDDKKVLNMFNYDKYRQVFLSKYQKYLGKNSIEITGLRK